MENMEQDINVDIDSIEIKDIIDINLLQEFQNDFAAFKGSDDNECVILHKYGEEKASQIGKPCIYTCYKGHIDFTAPINIIYNAIQLLENTYNCDKNSNKEDKFLKYSRVMKQNCYRFIRLINNYIDINKIGIGFYNFEKKNGEGIPENMLRKIFDVFVQVDGSIRRRWNRFIISEVIC